MKLDVILVHIVAMHLCYWAYWLVKGIMQNAGLKIMTEKVKFKIVLFTKKKQRSKTNLNWIRR